MTVYLLDTNHASPLVTLHHPLRRRVIQALDAGIAVTALRYDLTLLTTDGDFQAVPGLRHENWLRKE